MRAVRGLAPCVTLYAMRVAVAWLLVAPRVVWAGLRLLGLERGHPLVRLVAFTLAAAAAGVAAEARAGARDFSVDAIPGTNHRAVPAVLVLPRG